MPASVPVSSAAIDADNPWPGLASFTEDSRAFFFGREKETDELVRLIRRNTLTVLFGQSGLGKSSLLQAGAFPALREADFLPLYLRLDHSPDSPPLAEQVKSALTAAFASARADASAFRSSETLWEYFHRKDTDIWSAKNRLLTPVLAFDQFEEIFTLGRATDAQRERGWAFLVELADLVENRAPAELRAKFDSGELDIARYNFTKPSCQVVLSLREDFLPDLEGLKHEMRSIMQSRMRVRRLNGTQALEIVTRPAPHLLAEGVAERVVEFVAGARGGSAERLAELEVEPALLSVICRELNERRRALGQTQITTDLVSGNRREILTDFYERSVTDLPEAMRTFVEDHLLTKSGFRDNLALETALEFPGVTRPLIDTLVSRRLVRIEDRLGVQRVELTHDVLAEVIRASRDERQQRLALEQTRAAERRTRRRMWLARGLAAGLLVVAGAMTWAAYWAVQREKANNRRWSRSEVATATRLLDEGKAEVGLAALVHAARIDPENPVLAPRLLSALAARSFARPYGDAARLPASPSLANFASDGQTLVIRFGGGLYRTLDFETGRIVREFSVGSAVINTFILEDSVYARTDRTMAFYDVSTGKMRFRVPFTSGQGFAALSKGGRWFLSGGDGFLAIRDGSSGVIRGQIPHVGGMRSSQFSSDGSRLVVATDDDQARVWSVPDGKPVTDPMVGGHRVIYYADFSPDGRLIALATAEGAQLRDATTGQPVGPFLPHAGRTTAAGFTPDGTRLVTTSFDRTAKVWEVKTGQLVFPPFAHDVAVGGMRFAADGRRLLTLSTDRSLRIWDLTTGRLLIEPLRSEKGAFHRLDRNMQRIALLTAEGGLHRLRVEPGAVGPLALAGTETRLGSAWLREFPSTLRWVTETRLATIDVVTGREATGGFTYPEPIAAYIMAGNGRTMLVRTKTGSKQAWQLTDTGVKVLPIEKPPTGVNFPRLRSDGDIAAGTSGDALRELRIWDLRTGKLIGPPMAYATALYRPSINFSADGRWVGAGTSAGSAKIWEVATGRLVHDLKPVRGRVFILWFSPDGTRIATADALGARLWDAKTGQPIGNEMTHTGSDANVAGFSHNSRWLLTYAPVGGSMRVWDAVTGSPVGAIMEHPGAMAGPAFSPDDTKIATACVDGAARLWDTLTGQLVAEPMQHGAEVVSVTYSPDGRFIRTNCADKRVRIWAVPAEVAARTPEWLLRLATTFAGRTVSDDGAAIDATSELGRYEALCKEVNALPANAPFAAWGKWLVADPAKRTLAPGFELTVAEAEARGMIAPPAVVDPDADEPKGVPEN